MDQNFNPGMTDGRAYSLNDMVRAGCGGCEGCSSCCQGMGGIILTPGDIYKLTAHLGCSFEALMADKIKLQVEDGLILPSLQTVGETEACVFLDENGRCSIHSVRPGVCRLFPLGRSYEEDRIRYILLVNGCVKRDRTKVKVHKWIDTPDIEKEEAFLIKWHNFQKVARAAAGTGDPDKAKAVNMYILKLFYFTPYDVAQDFYWQFDIRLAQAYAEFPLTKQ